ncbi:hypothetical protein KC726_04210 [Candidatus Woesebacteria bacterium]|nr:hypothetical protein [Candidatus Woesebacteria bacterium]
MTTEGLNIIGGKIVIRGQSPATYMNILRGVGDLGIGSDQEHAIKREMLGALQKYNAIYEHGGIMSGTGAFPLIDFKDAENIALQNLLSNQMEMAQQFGYIGIRVDAVPGLSLATYGVESYAAHTPPFIYLIPPFRHNMHILYVKNRAYPLLRTQDTTATSNNLPYDSNYKYPGRMQVAGQYFSGTTKLADLLGAQLYYSLKEQDIQVPFGIGTIGKGVLRMWQEFQTSYEQ